MFQKTQLGTVIYQSCFELFFLSYRTRVSEIWKRRMSAIRYIAEELLVFVFSDNCSYIFVIIVLGAECFVLLGAAH